jgi:hypothetical protein
LAGAFASAAVNDSFGTLVESETKRKALRQGFSEKRVCDKLKMGDWGPFMSIFSNTDELYTVMKELWRRIKADEEMSKKLLESRLIVRFVYRDPDGMLTIDGSDGRELNIYAGPCDLHPVVEMSMRSDVAHNFWLGRENPALALISGKISSKGPVNKALALLPVVKPAFQIYPDVVEEVKKAA